MPRSWDHLRGVDWEATMRALLVAFVMAISALVGFASPASADYCVQSANGCENSGAQTADNCAGHGAFGAFGQNGDYGHDFRGGANGDRTAFNNSTLCGRPQGAAGE